jgi:prepilin-type N-terminal cleavage/methylation domain-containing protein
MAPVARPPHRRQRGFTLLEMVVALALFAVAMLLAGQLLGESRRLLVAGARKAQDPLATYVLLRLRSDVQAADRVAEGAPQGEWSEEALELPGAVPGSLVAYERQGEELVRRFEDGADASGRQAWMSRVERFRWRRLGTKLVEVELVSRRAPGFEDSRLSGRPETPAERVRVDRLVLAARGSGLGGGW